MFSLMKILVVAKIVFACVASDERDGVDCLQALETYLQSSSNVVVKQQQEINELQTLCQTLKKVSKLHIV
jgi:predicted transcriptional regulator